MSNKQRAVDFLEMIVKGDIDQAYSTYVASNCVHHNAYFPASIDTLKQGMKDSHIDMPNKFFEVQRTIEEGDIVVVHSKMKVNKDEVAVGTVIHMCRFDRAGQVCEFWDIANFVEDPTVNSNGLF